MTGAGRRVAGAVLVLVVAASCTPAEDKAVDTAADLARADVDTIAGTFTRLLQSERTAAEVRSAFRERGLRDVLYPRLADLGGGPDAVTVTVAATRTTTATDGFTTKTGTVRVCARLSGRPGPAATPTVENADCPADLPQSEPGLGGVDRTAPYRP